MISTLMIEKIEEELELVYYIWYPVSFKDWLVALLDSRSEINIISQVFTFKLELKIQKNNIGAQKIDGTILEIYRMAISTFFVSNQNIRERFFEKSFLLVVVFWI